MPLAPWPARAFVIAFTVAIAVCGALSIEAWPLTGWRLFSHQRRPVATGWIATSVDAHGTQTPIAFGGFPPADQHFLSIMRTFGALAAHEREAVCQAWARLVRRRGASTAGGLRLYATTRDMRLHVGRREPVAPTARLRWTCAGGHGARPAAAGAATGGGADLERRGGRGDRPWGLERRGVAAVGAATGRGAGLERRGVAAGSAAGGRGAGLERRDIAAAGAATGRGAGLEPRGVG